MGGTVTPAHEMLTYLIHDPSTGWSKVGVTQNLAQRLDWIRFQTKAPLFVADQIYGHYEKVFWATHRHTKAVDSPYPGTNGASEWTKLPLDALLAWFRDLKEN